MNSQVTPTKVFKSTHSDVVHTDLLAVEEPLQIMLGFGTLDDRQLLELVVTMRTPGNDLELAAGFLLGEGVITSPEEVIHIDHCGKENDNEADENVVRVELDPTVSVDPQQWKRHFTSNTSCGVCGKSSMEQVLKISKVIDSDLVISQSLILRLPGQISSYQVAFNNTGGMHAAGLYDEEGRLVFCREDIGRHNAVDKVVGAAFFKGNYPLKSSILLLSGRVGFELVQKAIMASVPIIAAIGAPSSLAVQLAKNAGVTMLGFLRDGGFNIYCGQHRIELK